MNASGAFQSLQRVVISKTSTTQYVNGTVFPYLDANSNLASSTSSNNKAL